MTQPEKNHPTLTSHVPRPARSPANRLWAGEQSCAQLTLTDDNDGSAIDFILIGENDDE